MERTFISWNIVNWITVFVMVLLGYLLISLLWQGVRRYMGAGSSSSGAAMTSSTYATPAPPAGLTLVPGMSVMG